MPVEVGQYLIADDRIFEEIQFDVELPGEQAQ